MGKERSGPDGRVAPVRLRYLWDSQVVIAVNERGDVLATAPVARLIMEAPRRRALLPPDDYAYEVDAIRDAVIAEAHLAGLPAPRGWVRRIHGKNILASKTREGAVTSEPEGTRGVPGLRAAIDGPCAGTGRLTSQPQPRVP